MTVLRTLRPYEYETDEMAVTTLECTVCGSTYDYYICRDKFILRYGDGCEECRREARIRPVGDLEAGNIPY